MAKKLEIEQGLLQQSADEIINYTITTTNWISSPTSSAAVAIDETTGETVTTTVFPTNSPSESGDIITLSPLKLLTKGHTYRIEVTFIVGTATYECYFRVECTI